MAFDYKKVYTEQSYELDFSQGRFHHEIYLSDARRCRPEKRKTILRQPIKRIEPGRKWVS